MAEQGNLFDPDLFRREHRIHVKDGSFFTQDHYIVVHPRELDESNEARLTTKLIKHYTVPSPNYFGFSPRGPLALQLASLVPISLQAKRASIANQMLELYKEQKTGRDENLAESMLRRRAPFDALVRGYLEDEKTDPIATEFAQNAITLYLLVNEALQARGYMEEAAAYAPRTTSPDVILVQLESKLGISAQEFSNIASQEGPRGLAKRLGISDKTLGEIRQVVAISAANHFSDNIVENWNVGRNVQSMEGHSVAERVQVGLLMRVHQKIEALRAAIHHKEVPENIGNVERMVVSTLRDLPPELVEMLYVSGTEFAYTPDPSVGALDQESGRALGFYRPATYDEGHEFGVRQIFVSARQSTQEFRENLAHETHHLFFPKRFSVEQRAEIDDLLAKGVSYMKGLKLLVDAWYEGAPEHRDAVKAEIDERYCRPQGTTLEQALRGMNMDSFRDAVHDACDNLDPHSPYLTKAAYDAPESRVAEIISRYAEMKYVRRQDFPQALDLIAPQMRTIYDQYYLPHIREQLTYAKEVQKDWPEHMKNSGSLPSEQPMTMEQIQQLKGHLTFVHKPTLQVSSLESEHCVVSHPLHGPEADIDRITHMQGYTPI